MSNATEPKPKGQGPLGVRVAVWLLVLGLALVGIVVIGVSRRTATTIATAQPPHISDTSTPRARGVASSVPEPVHQGRRLSEWIEDLKTGDFKTKAAAQDALVAIGSQAIPALAELLSDTRAANAAAFALARIGRDALPVLLDALTNGTTLARGEVAGVMGWFHQDTEQVVPALVECMRHEEAGVVGNAIASLPSIPTRPDIVVPALIDCFTNSNWGVRENAAGAIRKFGHDAQPAISNLVWLARHDAHSGVRGRAAESLRVISPERADREGL